MPFGILQQTGEGTDAGAGEKRRIIMKYIDLNDLRRRAGNIINTEWKSSWYWGKEPKLRHWTMDAKHDCIKRIAEVEEELARLKAMRRELEDICPRYIPEDEEPWI